MTGVQGTLAERFWAKVDRWDPDECWEWRGTRDTRGYGYIGDSGGTGQARVTLAAHRVAYTLAVGPIPVGQELDHLCRVPSCVNPKHLEPVTHAENMRRSRQRVCKRGHPQTPENVYTRVTAGPRNGDRQCLPCERMRGRSRPLRSPAEAPRHGTASVYAYYRCRCAECRRAHAEAEAKRKKARNG